jgi:Protein of unknown function (DUF4232)
VKVRIALAALAGAATLATAGVAFTAPSAGASTVPAATVSHVTYAPPGCATWQLSATLTRGPQTVWNYRELVLTLTNTSRYGCVVSGYPGLQLLNSSYRPLPTTTVRVPGRTFWPANDVLLPGRSVTADITFSVAGYIYPLRNYPWPPIFQQSAAYLVVTVPGSYQVYGQHFVLKIPGGPVRIVQNRLYETPLMWHFPVIR